MFVIWVAASQKLVSFGILCYIHWPCSNLHFMHYQRMLPYNHEDWSDNKLQPQANTFLALMDCNHRSLE